MPLLKTEQESVPAVNHTAPLDTAPKADNKALSSPSCDGDDEKVTTPPTVRGTDFILFSLYLNVLNDFSTPVEF